MLSLTECAFRRRCKTKNTYEAVDVVHYTQNGRRLGFAGAQTCRVEVVSFVLIDRDSAHYEPVSIGFG